ncbi:adenylate/guanylate cyclase domain-containing protein [Haliangium ochraceum]|uniref:Adenylate/guanylate cyclase with GAF sensor and FHA domain protein n=1 Tax=Haliangium ochraceum (strain DSM 14365 / JCM 11303 / SMP-2) TaxID=502025 RepID=D0LQ25_HALO1|nr:adenylate/guanylate cyclase domain-containing protein [Haliangium ochraceum]ACY17062.1 adenylate/guanylate cyclase with GAF sensor and FHA domain protein [Haliangium ochraceum DSM 14365]
MAKLILISGDEQQEYELVAFNTIGRHPDNTIQILDRIISKEHAQIQRLPDARYLLRDLRSLNGTFMKGERITERFLEDGDEITMGSTRLRFVDQGPDDDALHRVTIAPGSMTESHIRQRINAASGKFLPERSITDEKVLRRDYERLRLGHELASAVGSELDLEKLLPKILDKAFELVGADRGAILLNDLDGSRDLDGNRETDKLIPRYVKTRNGKGDKNIVLSNTVISQVLQNKESVLSSDATMDKRFSSAHSIIMQGIRSTMTVPLLHSEELLGVMHLDSQIQSNAFTEKDLQICTGMAAQAAIAIQNARLAKRIERETQTRTQFSRLIPPAVVEQLVKGELTLERGGRLSEITMLYSDIRGFTAMADKKPPAEVVNTLNEYFEVMVDVLFKHSGTLDKFVGDEIIGLFGAPIPIEDGPFQAVLCAKAMMDGLEEFNRTREAENQQPIKIGIGINTGQVITGAIGSTRALQYTAIGDAMNVASRLVAIADPGEIIMSEETYRQVSDRVDAEAMPPVKVKGKADMQKVHRFIAIRRPHEWNGEEER